MEADGGDEAAWRRRRELASLLLTCRSRLAPLSAGGRDRRLRQSDVAALVGISSRYYAGFERGEAGANPSDQLVADIATALRMDGAERSALHILALGHDPPIPVPLVDSPQAPPPVPAVMRNLVRRLDPTPAAVIDEMWTVLARNDAMSRHLGGAPEEPNLIMYLFSSRAEEVVGDVHVERRAAIAALRYQYIRHIASERFAELVARLLATGPEARQLWERGDIAIPRKMSSLRVRSGSCWTEVSVVTTALTHRLSLLVAMPSDMT
ncbi:MAG TPA: helix-turn-helix transcriptional regulator [Streptosporangiaceae bacterium]|jgi:transcriptional regulator with XRE-family HTH domain